MLSTSCSMSERILWLDGWRGLACWLMIGYHLFFDCVMFGWLPQSAPAWWPAFVLQRFIALSFIFLSGVSAHFTRSNLRRGLITAAAALVVSVVSYGVHAPIRYGMLEFLSCAMILWHFTGKTVGRVPDRLAPWLWVVLYLVTRVISYTTFVDVQWLYWLGLRAHGFVSYDWVPFFPNIFMFLLGSWFGSRLAVAPKDSLLRRAGAPKWLTWPGQRTLIIYLLHQPVLYGVCWIANQLLK